MNIKHELNTFRFKSLETFGGLVGAFFVCKAHGLQGSCPPNGNSKLLHEQGVLVVCCHHLPDLLLEPHTRANVDLKQKKTRHVLEIKTHFTMTFPRLSFWTKAGTLQTVYCKEITFSRTPKCGPQLGLL